MRKEYDFSQSLPNPYALTVKKKNEKQDFPHLPCSKQVNEENSKKTKKINSLKND
ncbi:MAG: hypothetical protein Q8R58_06245 [Sulfuricurvum sp.]|nr:hypothetical protein [Sulfuricurvum sp.]